MIGVICDPHQEWVVREFFELFKTPWELVTPGASYDALLVSGDASAAELSGAQLVISLAQRPHQDGNGDATRRYAPAVLRADGIELPLFFGAEKIPGSGHVRGRLAGQFSPIVVESRQDGVRLIRCGYSLFDEVELLLTQGQPAEHARTPTLDLHIELLRRWLIYAGIEVVELHPTPPGCGLLASLTHDIDFFGVRRHGLDRTLLGFVYRASIGSLVDLVRGRGSLRRLVRNWLALLSLPLVYTGVVEDFWLPFERYLEADDPWRSTFFVVPFRGWPGVAPGGRAPSARAVPYEAREVEPELRKLTARGCEVAVHGIDAWRDSEIGRQELAAVSEAAESKARGVRIHWLYFDEGSFAHLDDAGFDYDATFGYNEAVGFRAGTSQVFAPRGARHLLELPLHIQDTSLFYRARMHCREDEARGICREIIDSVCRHGGVVTLSWHERSLAPERQWNRPYDELLALLRARNASVRPAREVVSWFRVRRSVELEGVRLSSHVITRLANADRETGPDGLRVRIYSPERYGAAASPGYIDLELSVEELTSVVRDAQAVRS